MYLPDLRPFYSLRQHMKWKPGTDQVYPTKEGDRFIYSKINNNKSAPFPSLFCYFTSTDLKYH
ncbi:hypothetical protein EMIT0194MI4_80258 [Pseudomonas sp. IT-194MI4]